MDVSVFTVKNILHTPKILQRGSPARRWRASGFLLKVYLLLTLKWRLSLQ
jgi:hypothetical protein